jgi:hypothetical protein
MRPKKGKVFVLLKYKWQLSLVKLSRVCFHDVLDNKCNSGERMDNNSCHKCVHCCGGQRSCWYRRIVVVKEKGEYGKESWSFLGS